MAQAVVQIGLVVVVLLIPLGMFWYWLTARRGRDVPLLRRIRGFDAMQGQLGRGIETGRAVHISIGTGGIVGNEALVTIASASIVESLADEAAESGASPTVSVADGTAMVLAQDLLRRPHAARGQIADHDPMNVQVLGMDPIQYTVGAMEYLAHSQPVSNTMVGSFGPEVALLAEAGVRAGLSQVAGATDVRALAVLRPVVDHLIVGEDVLAAAAYVNRKRGHIERLQAQDLARFALVFLIILGVVLSMLLQG